MAFVKGLRSNLFPKTSALYGVSNAVQSLAGWATVANKVEVGVAEDEVEWEKNRADMGERDSDD